MIFQEFDHPHTLLQNSNGFLYKMVQQTGKTTEENLHKVAADVSLTIRLS